MRVCLALQLFSGFLALIAIGIALSSMDAAIAFKRRRAPLPPVADGSAA
jgi:hypothetical protein